jgi:phenylacetate-CoA ligase
VRIKGWMGRADQTTKVKGMFVHPVAGRRRRQAPFRDRKGAAGVTNPDSIDQMTLNCEVAAPVEALEKAIADTVRDITKLRAEVKLVAAGSLANDGKVIEDARKYD